VVLYLDYSKQINLQKTEQQSLNAVQANLDKLNKNKADQNAELKTAQEQIARLKTDQLNAEQLLEDERQSLPDNVDNIDYNEILFSLADSCNVTLMSLSSSEPAAKSENGVMFIVSNYALILKGANADVLNFLHIIAVDSRFINGTINSVNTSAVEEDTPQGTMQYTQADVSLSLYAYEGI